MADKDSELQKRLSSIRSEIDDIDLKLLKLLSSRAELSLEVGRIKASEEGIIFKPLREQEILNELFKNNSGPLPDEHLRAIWREIISSSRVLQRPQNVAYLGPEGTFSYFAGKEYLGNTNTFLPVSTIADVFQHVTTGTCEIGIVPLENSLQGTVGVSFDLFLEHEVVILSEFSSRISHCLLSNSTSLTDIKKIYSHPQPLAQCSNWLSQNLPNVAKIPTESTAAAAHYATKEKNTASVGHFKLSEMLNLNILANRIENHSGNWTRFVIIGPKTAKYTSKNIKTDKTSILFTLPDKVGALSKVLTLLAKNSINLRKLESRPMRAETWKYVFFVDIACNLENEIYSNVLEELKEICTSFRILGTYLSGPNL